MPEMPAGTKAFIIWKGDLFVKKIKLAETTPDIYVKTLTDYKGPEFRIEYFTESEDPLFITPKAKDKNIEDQKREDEPCQKPQEAQPRFPSQRQETEEEPEPTEPTHSFQKKTEKKEQEKPKKFPSWKTPTNSSLMSKDKNKKSNSKTKRS